MRTSYPIALAALLAVTAPAPAGVIVGYDPASPASHATYDRFVSGFPTAPVANQSPLFVGAGVGLTGVGWRTDAPQFGVTLITPQHFLAAAHVGVGGRVSFTNGAGAVFAFDVSSTTRLPTMFTGPGGETQTLPSDLLLGTLTSPVPAGTGIRPVPIAGVSAAGVIDSALLVYGQNTAYSPEPGNPNPHLGTNVADGVTLASFDGFASEATQVLLYDYTPGAPGEIYLIGGDSGSPAFVRVGGQLALVGVHYGVTNPTTDPRPGDVSASTFVPAYIEELRRATAGSGFSITVLEVPEPGTLGVALALAVTLRLTRARFAKRREKPPAPEMVC
jgi:hypothetical protein